MNRRDFIKTAASAGALGCTFDRGGEPEIGRPWGGWREGHFQIHVIYTGVCESLFLVFPDSTSMLIDCGNHAACKRGELAVPIMPDLSRHAGEWISRYVRDVNPRGAAVDYMLLTHYHADHAGNQVFHAGRSKNGRYFLSGFGEAIEYLDFRYAIDRAWPMFDDPVPMDAGYDNGVIANMREVYRELERRGCKVERFRLEKGSDQIRPLHGEVEGFRTVPLCANGRVLHSDGQIEDVMGPLIAANPGGKVNENPMSIGLRFEYGPFRFFTAGDFAHHQWKPGRVLFEAEGELAKVCGRCQVAKINHHGHHSMPLSLVKALRSQVYLAGIWDQLHVTRDTMRNLANRKGYFGERIFAPGVFTARRRKEDALESWLAEVEPSVFEPSHVVVDVAPSGTEYSLFTLDAKDESRIVKSKRVFIS